VLDRARSTHASPNACLLTCLQYAAKEFGTCPLVQCAGQPVLPVGLKDEMGADTVKIFCAKCQCVYHPPPVRSRSTHHSSAGAAGVDGAAFGTTFPHLFLMTFSNLVPDRLLPTSAYIPRVFGFRVHLSARQRASVAAATISASVRPLEGKAPSKRLPFTRRSGTSIETIQDVPDRQTSIAGDDDSPAKDLDAVPSNSTMNDSASKSTKAAPPPGKQPRGDDTKDDEGSRKSKGGKRRSDDGGSKGGGNGIAGDDDYPARDGDTTLSNPAPNDSATKSAKAAPLPNKQPRDDTKDDDGSRKSKGAKRRVDDGGSKGSSNGIADGNPANKRRRKPDNGNS
jgi:Casein kinase II regulatory subunit